jgi:hypothetical protein
MAEQNKKININTEDYPPGVRGISWDQVGKLGVRESDNALFWDGKELVTKKIIKLRFLELLFAFIVTASTAGMFIISLLSYLKGV